MAGAGFDVESLIDIRSVTLSVARNTELHYRQRQDITYDDDGSGESWFEICIAVRDFREMHSDEFVAHCSFQ